MAKKRKKRNPRKHVVTNHLGICFILRMNIRDQSYTNPYIRPHCRKFRLRNSQYFIMEARNWKKTLPRSRNLLMRQRKNAKVMSKIAAGGQLAPLRRSYTFKYSLIFQNTASEYWHNSRFPILMYPGSCDNHSHPPRSSQYVHNNTLHALHPFSLLFLLLHHK